MINERKQFESFGKLWLPYNNISLHLCRKAVRKFDDELSIFWYSQSNPVKKKVFDNAMFIRFNYINLTFEEKLKEHVTFWQPQFAD